MFKFFLSRYKSLKKGKKFVFPTNNAAEIVPIYSSYLTDCCPKTGKIITNGIVKLFYGNGIFLNIANNRQAKTLMKNPVTKPILVIADLNIGDALNLQVACQTLKQLFPNKEIHYAMNRNAFPLLKDNPYISKSFPIFSGAAIPSEDDIKRLKSLTLNTDYALIFNFCPFFDADTFTGMKGGILNHYPLTMSIAYDELKTTKQNHIRYKIFSYLTNLFPEKTKENKVKLKNVPSYFSDENILEAKKFLKNNGMDNIKGIVFFNPDATSPYTRLPLSIQVQFIKKLIKGGVNNILIGSAFVFKNAEAEIINSLTTYEQKKCIIVPNKFSLGTYGALIDYCDVYITNDTGPLHLAATEKWTISKKRLRNKTAIFSVFGATPSRIYAYDSKKEGYFPAPQDAPSMVFTGTPPCRNITCINKLSKRCKEVRCFSGFNTEASVNHILMYLKENIWI